MPFLDRLQRWAAERPQRPAVSSAERSLTFSGLLSAAAESSSAGTTAVCLPNSLKAVIAVIGSLAGTGCCTVLDPSWPPAQRTAVLERLRPDRFIDSIWRSVSGGTEQLVDGPPDSDFLIGLTSGTTAYPKAYSRTRRSWQMSLEVSGKMFGAEPGGCTLVLGPLSSGLNLYALAECMWEGMEFRMVPASGTATILSTLETYPVTRLVVVPTQLQMLAERAVVRPHGSAAGRRLRHIVCAGAKLSPLAIAAVRRWAPEAVLHEYYGASELSFVTTSALLPGLGRGAAPG
jgi:long-chain acyl-CoA synthetase